MQGEAPTDKLLASFRSQILDPGREEIVRPYHLGRNLLLARRMTQLARSADLVVSSTSDSWKSKIAFVAAHRAGRPIAFRKETWRADEKLLSGPRAVNAWIQDRLTRAIERRAAAVLVAGTRARELPSESCWVPGTVVGIQASMAVRTAADR